MADRNDFDALAAAVRTAGGVRAVAFQAGLDPGNLSRYLRGGSGLAAARIAALWATLGRPDGQADAARVLTLHAETVEELIQAFRWHLPDGGQLARIAWTTIMRQRAMAAVGRIPLPELLAATNGSTRIVALLPAGTVWPPDLLTALHPILRWWRDDPDAAVLDPTDPVPWVNGVVDPCMFAAAWPGGGFTPTAEDVIAEIRRLRIGYAEAIRRLHRASR